MRTKHVSRGLISLHVNFWNDQTLWTGNLLEKQACGGGGRKKNLPVIFAKCNLTLPDCLGISYEWCSKQAFLWTILQVYIFKIVFLLDPVEIQTMA